MALNALNKTKQFIDWLNALKDPIGKAGIAVRLKRVESGNFGDHKLLPDTGGVYEMRIFKGNGYRVYYARQEQSVYLLLMGGGKDRQQADINKAKLLWQKVQDEQDEQD